MLQVERGDMARPKLRQIDLRASFLPMAVLILGTALWTLIIARTHFKLEDAFITFRYVANIVSGKGFVFNPGERVLGTTTPLQTLLLALFAYPFGPRSIPAVATVAMPLAGLLAGLAGYMALVRRGIPAGGAALGMGLLYTNTGIIRTGIGGMETPLVLLLMGLSLWALITRRPIVTGVLCGLLALCRIDGLIWVALIFGASLLRSWRDTIKQAGAFVLVLLPWVIFATLYFGSPVPNSMMAKGVVRPGMEHALADLERMVRYGQWFISGTGFSLDWRILPLWIVVLAVGVRKVLQQRPRELTVLVVFPPIYALSMYLGRAPRYEWYLIPITFISLLIAGVGIYEIYRWVAMTALRRTPAFVNYLIAGVAAVLAVNYAYGAVPMGIRHLRMAQENEDGFRRVVGLWLYDHTPTDASVAMEAIGYQGYYSERRIVDMAGLVTPRAVGYKRRTRQNGQIFDWILRDFKPDYFVLRSFEVDTNRHFNGGPLFLTSEKEQEFRAAYREAKRFTAPYPDSAPLVRHLTVYERIR